MNRGLVLFIIAFAFISLFGLWVNMAFTQNGDMAGCPLMSDTASMCQMNALEHLAYWQQLFTATAATDGALASILLLLPLFFGVIFQKGKEKLPELSFKIYKRNNPQQLLFNYLTHAFRRGILHPKIY